jgi:hypothetical protein
MTNYEAGRADGLRESAEAIKILSKRLVDLAADRDEWRQQHENLLTMYRAQTQELAKVRTQLDKSRE